MEHPKLAARRVLKLGVIDFETPAQTERLQRDMIKRLCDSTANRQRLAGLANCTLHSCGRKDCIEACWWAQRRDRQQLIPKVHKLLSNSATPLCEVRLIHGDWSR